MYHLQQTGFFYHLLFLLANKRQIGIVEGIAVRHHQLKDIEYFRAAQSAQSHGQFVHQGGLGFVNIKFSDKMPYLLPDFIFTEEIKIYYAGITFKLARNSDEWRNDHDVEIVKPVVGEQPLVYLLRQVFHMRYDFRILPRILNVL